MEPHAEEAIFRGELEKLGCNPFQLRLSLVLSEPPERLRGLEGILDSTLIAQLVGDIRKDFYVCGPRAMHDFCRAA